MKALTLLVLFLLSTAVVGSPNLTHTVPHCQPDIHSLPIYEVEAISEIIYADGTTELEATGGTAFLVDTNTWITASHVIKKGQTNVALTVYANGRAIPMTIQHNFPEVDVAILTGDSAGFVPIKTENKFPGIDVPVYNIGYPGFGGGLLLSYTGYITGTTEYKVQLNAYVDNGMSGGPTLWCDGDQLTVYGMIHALGLKTIIRRVHTSRGADFVDVFRNSGYSYVIPGIRNILDWTKRALGE